MTTHGLTSHEGRADTTAAPQPQLVQRRCACGGTPGVGGECTECRAKRLRGEQAAPQPATRLMIGAPGDRYEQEAERVASAVVNRQPAGGAPVPEITPAVEAQVRGLAGGGSALPQEERGLFERRLGLDFGRVRIHTDPRAAESASALRARAYTFGSDIAFAPGAYAPGTAAGRALLAHELTHVAQQTRPGAAAVRGRELRRSPIATTPATAHVQRSDDTCTFGEIGSWAITSVRDFTAPAGLGNAKASIGAVCSPANCSCVDGSSSTAPGDQHAWANIVAASGSDQSGGGNHMCVGSQNCWFVHGCDGCSGARQVRQNRATPLAPTGSVTVGAHGTLYFYNVPFQGWCTEALWRSGCHAPPPPTPPRRPRRTEAETSDEPTAVAQTEAQPE